MAQTIRSIGSSGSSGSIGSIDASRGIDAAKKSEYGIRDHSPGWSYNLKERREEKDINSDISPQAMKLPDLESLSSMLYAQAAPVQTDFLTDKYTTMWKSTSALMGLPTSKGMDLSQYADMFGLQKTSNYGLPMDSNTNTILISAKQLQSDPSLRFKAAQEAQIMGGAGITIVNDIEGEEKYNVEWYRGSDGKKTYFDMGPTETDIRSYYGIDADNSYNFPVWYRDPRDGGTPTSPGVSGSVSVGGNPVSNAYMSKFNFANIVKNAVAGFYNYFSGDDRHRGETRNTGDLGTLLENAFAISTGKTNEGGIQFTKVPNKEVWDELLTKVIPGVAAAASLSSMGDKFDSSEFMARQTLNVNNMMSQITGSLLGDAKISSFGEAKEYVTGTIFKDNMLAYSKMTQKQKDDIANFFLRASNIKRMSDDNIKTYSSKFDGDKYTGEKMFAPSEAAPSGGGTFRPQGISEDVDGGNGIDRKYPESRGNEYLKYHNYVDTLAPQLIAGYGAQRGVEQRTASSQAQVDIDKYLKQLRKNHTK